MTVKGLVLAALGLGAALAVAPAGAQPPGDSGDLSEMMCVYEELMQLEDDAYFDIVDAHIQDATDGALFDSVYETIVPALDSCSEEHDWDDEKQEIALMVGILGTVGDAVEGELLEHGVTEEQLDRFVGIVDELSTDDVFALADGTWREDAPLKQRVTDQLKAKGYPEDAELLRHGLFLVEAYVGAMIQLDAWIEATGR